MCSFTSKQVPRIIDFGHASPYHRGLIFGTPEENMPPCYAPEVCAGARTTPASDVFTMGIALGSIMETADLYTELSHIVEL